MRKKLLIVEDDVDLQRLYAMRLPDFDILEALTATQGWQKFKEEQETIDAIVLDGDLGESNFFGHHLAQEIRRSGYTGPILATSSDPELRSYLMRDGCTHSVDKRDLPKFLKTLFTT